MRSSPASAVKSGSPDHRSPTARRVPLAPAAMASFRSVTQVCTVDREGLGWLLESEIKSAEK